MFEDSRDVLIAQALKFDGRWDLMYRAISRHEYPERQYFEQIKTIKSKVVTMLDEDYPPFLNNVCHPPMVLFYYGDISLLGDYYKNISVVGSRECSDYGIEMTKRIVGDLSKKGYVIISGLAKGIDTIAHQTAIQNGGKTIAILGSGIDYCYPFENRELYRYLKEKHLVISEYPGHVEPDGYHFPIRNRIIAGLSKTLIVAEAYPRSGSLVTASLALSMNADVMCVPYPAGQKSQCNRLIMSGATLIENVDDVLNQMSRF